MSRGEGEACSSMEWEDEEGKMQSPLLPDGGGGAAGDDGDDSSQKKQPQSPAPAKHSINSHYDYGHRIGALLSLSLALSTGFIVYAHLGLSAVILSNQNLHIGNADQSIVSRSPRKLLPDNVPSTTTSAGNGKSTRGEGACQNSDLGAIQKWYTVYNLTYPKSIKAAWNGGAKLLSVIIVVFSGIWPYLKNIMLLAVWYMPSTIVRQTAVIHWLSCLSKYTLVDVFAVMGVIIGIQLQLQIPFMGELVTRAEPRFGIISFFVATVWVCLHIELIKELHERAISAKERLEKREKEGPSRRPASLFISPLLLAVSVGLYVWGAMSEMVVISSRGCDKSYNLVTLANAIVNEHSMAGNFAVAMTWTLYLSYVVLVLVMPMLAHLLQALFLFGWVRSRETRELAKWASAVWNFACVEVLLIGIFAMEYKYSHLIKAIAGDTSAQFLDASSKLSLGFYILIGYSVSSNILQYFLGRCLKNELLDGPAHGLSS